MVKTDSTKVFLSAVDGVSDRARMLRIPSQD